MLYTSSTTDDIKGVMLNHVYLTAISRDCSPDADPLDVDETVVYAAPSLTAPVSTA
nr:hypothetical protein [Pseudomonas syringae]